MLGSILGIILAVIGMSSPSVVVRLNVAIGPFEVVAPPTTLIFDEVYPMRRAPRDSSISFTM